MPSICERLQDHLRQNGVGFTVLTHEPVFTSEQAAAVRGTSLASGAKALVVLIGLHAGAALFHRLVLRDGVLQRMLPRAPERSRLTPKFARTDVK